MSVCIVRCALAEAAPELRVLSSRPDAVSGGDALVALSAPAHARWSVELNGRDVTSAFRATDSGEHRARLPGLNLGRNALTMRVGGQVSQRLEILNHPLQGPIISGPHQQPFICQTLLNGLGPAENAECYARTVVQYYYKSMQTNAPAPVEMGAEIVTPPGALTPGFKTLDPKAPLPSDIATTVTSTGETADYIVRREIGVINRAVYEIQFLHRPGDALPSPWNGPARGWNGRLAYEFKVGCQSGYRQGTLKDAIGEIQEPLLAQGYALARSTLNDFANTCNDRISAETLSMVKEHFIEQFGPPVHTIGWGGSGGAMQVQLIAQNYPGLLDGIIAMASFPDMPSTMQWSDCALLAHAIRSSHQAWSDPQKSAVSGFATPHLCFTYLGAETRPGSLDPGDCNAVLPRELVYDREKNPNGAQCDLYSNEVNVFGRDAVTGRALRPLDNVGVQYGLVAFNRGSITTEQFVELNETIGGFDRDGNWIPERSVADPEAIRRAYERGILLTGGGGLGSVPIIDWRPYSDDLGTVDGHVRYLSFVTRARLMAANGNADNQVMLVDPRSEWFGWSGWRSHFWGPIGSLVRHMDRWLDNFAADRDPGSVAARIVRTRPKDLDEGCTAPDGEKIAEPAVYGAQGRCNHLYPAYAGPRMAAGGPLSDDVLKCVLRPLNRSDYKQPLSEDQLKRLGTVFSAGVCDYGQPGFGQTVTQKTWQRF